MANSRLAAVQRACRYIRYIFLVMTGFFLLLTTMCVVIVVLLAMNPSIDVGNHTSFDALSLTSAAVMGAIFTLVLYSVFELISSIGKESTPFIQKNVVLMKRISILMVLSIVLDVAIHVISWLSTGKHDLSIDTYFALLVGSAVVYALAVIFQYGVELQNETDGFV